MVSQICDYHECRLLPFLLGRWKVFNILFPKIFCWINLFLKSSPLLYYIQRQCGLNDRVEGSQTDRNISCQGHGRCCCCRSRPLKSLQRGSFYYPYWNVKCSNLFSKTLGLTDLARGRIKAVIPDMCQCQLDFIFFTRIFSLLG